MSNTTQLLTKNAFDNLGQATVSGFFNNLSFTPTVEELNRNVTSSADAAHIFFGTKLQSADEPVEPAFGTHIREAAVAVRRLLGR